RLRGYCRRTASFEPGRTRGGGGARFLGARGFPPAFAPLLCDEGEMAREGAARILGPQRAATEGRATRDWLGRSARRGGFGLWGLRAEDGGDHPPLLRRTLDRCADATRQDAGCVCSPHGAVGASVCVVELPGQAARCDDARARTRTRRASG